MKNIKASAFFLLLFFTASFAPLYGQCCPPVFNTAGDSGAKVDVAKPEVIKQIDDIPVKSITTKDYDKPEITITVYTGKYPDGRFWCPPCRSYAPVFEALKEKLVEKHGKRIGFKEILVYRGSDASSPSGAVPCVTSSRGDKEEEINRPMNIEDIEKLLKD